MTMDGAPVEGKRIPDAGKTDYHVEVTV